MFSWFSENCPPIGIDIGTRSLKLAQANRRGDKLIDAVRWELPFGNLDQTERIPDNTSETIEALKSAISGRQFIGKRAVYCLGADQLKILNVRLINVDPGEVGKSIRNEVASRLNFSIHEAEIRRIEVPDVVNDGVREFIVFACHRKAITRIIRIAEAIDLEPVAIDIEPMAVLRSTQFIRRRQEDQSERFIYLNIGYSHTLLSIFQGDCPLFIKYLPFGGARFTMALAKWLGVSFEEAHEMRRNNDDRPIERRDPEVNQTILTAMRPALEGMLSEIAMCIRYHSVSFRGKALSRLVVGGGEANSDMIRLLSQSFPQEVMRSCSLCNASSHRPDRNGQWDVAVGLSMKKVAA